MFLLALTRQPIGGRFPRHRVLEYDCAGRAASLFVDGRICRMRADDDGFALFETLPGCEEFDERTAFSRLEFRKAENVLSLDRRTRAGLPIYYRIEPTGEFYVSSHIALLRQAGVSIREDSRALPEFFVYNYVSPPRTMYEGISQVPCGARLSVALGNGDGMRIGQEWLRLPQSGTGPVAIEAICDETLGLLEASFEVIAPLAPRVAMLLSGGLDSSVLFRLANRKLGIAASYSTGFPFQSKYENLESDYALSAAEAFGSRHTYHSVTNQDFQRAIVRSIAIAEEPLLFVQPAMFHLIFGEGLPSEKEIVVSGQGADALFGMPTHHNFAWSENRNPIVAALAKDPIIQLARAILPETPLNRRRIARLSHVNRSSRPFSDPKHVLWTFGAFGSEEWACRQFGAGLEDIVGGRYRSLEPFADRNVYDLVSILAFFGEIPARKNIWSKLAHSHGRTVFYPYNEETLVKYVFSLGWNVKLTDAKAVLQGVARRLQVPDFIIDRPKSGFGIRPRHIAQVGGILEPLVPLASNLLGDDVLGSMRQGDQKITHTFWNAINYAIWKRTCIDNESADALIDEMMNDAPQRHELNIAPR